MPASAADATPADFEEQFAALLAARPAVASTIMGVLLPHHVQQLKDAGIAWIACATTLSARAAQDAGADAVVAQGAEAGGHRGAFDPAMAERQLVGLFALLPRLADHLQIPVIAAGGIADGRGIAAALTLGPAPCRSAPPSCARPKRRSLRRGLIAGRQRTGRHLADPCLQRSPGSWPGDTYVRAAAAEGAPAPRPYPVQRGLTAPMRKQAAGKPPGGDAGLGRAVGVDGAGTASRRRAARHVEPGAGTAAMTLTCNGQPAQVEDLLPALVNYGHFTSLQVRDHGAGTGPASGAAVACHARAVRQQTGYGAGAGLDGAGAAAGRPGRCLAAGDGVLALLRFPQSAGGGAGGRAGGGFSAGDADRLKRVRSVTWQRELPQLKHVGTFGLFAERRAAMAEFGRRAVRDRRWRSE